MSGFQEICCPFCGQVHPYPTGTINETRACGCGASWYVDTEPGDVFNELDPDEFEILFVNNVGEFEGDDTPGFVEPTYAVFSRAKPA